MAETTPPDPNTGANPPPTESRLNAATVVQAQWILRIAFTLVPLVAGIDKFFNALTVWERFLAPWFIDLCGGHAVWIMYGVGCVEILAALGVMLWPRVFAYIVALWLLAIIIHLLTIPDHYSIALRDFGLMMGALALARLSQPDPRRG